jgi:hypothetical protein
LQSRYYNPDWGRFVNADEITASTGELLTGNMFAYCRNNPVNHADPDGNWIVDAFFLAVDAGEFIKHPSIKNAGWVFLDVACFADPTGAGSTIAHGAKVAHVMEETLHAVDEAEKTVEIAGKSRKLTMNLQLFAQKAVRRTGNQQALAELGKESISKAKRGKHISYEEAKILDKWAKEYKVDQHHQAYRGNGKHWPGGNNFDHTHIYNMHVPYKY